MSNTNKTILEVKNLNFSYTRQTILKDISFKINYGDFVSIIGPNGGGKTTLLKIILGIIKPQKAHVQLFSKSIKHFRDWEKIGYLKQKNNFDKNLPFSVQEILSIGICYENKFFKKLSGDNLKNINKALDIVKMLRYKNELFCNLSGGQQQRVLLAMTIVNNPKILILDEPTSFLDNEMSNQFFKIVRDINEKCMTTIIFVTHDPYEIGKYADKIMILDEEVIFFGNKKQFCKSGKVGKYIGPFAQHIIDHIHDESFKHNCPIRRCPK